MTYRTDHLSVLVLLTTFTAMALPLIGFTLETIKQHFKYECNCVKNRRVVSLFS